MIYRNDKTWAVVFVGRYEIWWRHRDTSALEIETTRSYIR